MSKRVVVVGDGNGRIERILSDSADIEVIDAEYGVHTPNVEVVSSEQLNAFLTEEEEKWKAFCEWKDFCEQDDLSEEDDE